MTDKIVVAKLVSGEEIIGVLKREYAEQGGLVMSNIMEICEDERGCILRPFILSDDEDITINYHAIVTHANAMPDLQEVYLDSEKYWPKNAFKTFKMGKNVKDRKFN